MASNLISIWINSVKRAIRYSRFVMFLESILSFITLTRNGFRITRGVLSTKEDIYRFWWKGKCIKEMPDICQPTRGHWCVVMNGGSRTLSSDKILGLNPSQQFIDEWHRITTNTSRWPSNGMSKFYNKDYHYQMGELKKLEDDEK